MTDPNMFELEAADMAAFVPLEDTLSPEVRLTFRDCRRNCALPASPVEKLSAFAWACGHLADVAARQGVPAGDVAELLADLALAHGYFGRDPGEIEASVATALASVGMDWRAAA